MLSFRCSHEYLDLYAELEEPNQKLITTAFGGRYCGRSLPRKRVSLHQALVVGFYSDQAAVDDEVFHGSYEFIDASMYPARVPLQTVRTALLQLLSRLRACS